MQRQLAKELGGGKIVAHKKMGGKGRPGLKLKGDRYGKDPRKTKGGKGRI